jgi:predicted branched-subunit amino acid permease
MPRAGTAADWREPFMEAVRDALPIMVAITPFGFVAGVAAAAAGLPLVQAIAISYIVYAGAAQLAALQLMTAGSPILVILVTTFLLNVRFSLYSALFAEPLRRLPVLVRLWMASIMTDQTMALGSRRFRDHPERGGKVAYFLGVSIPMWVVWTSAATIGVFVGAAVPAGWSLDFAVPLVFLTLWVSAMRSGTRAVRLAGATAAVVAFAAQTLPFNLGLMVATFAGIGVASVMEFRAPPAADTAKGSGGTA